MEVAVRPEGDIADYSQNRSFGIRPFEKLLRRKINGLRASHRNAHMRQPLIGQKRGRAGLAKMTQSFERGIAVSGCQEPRQSGFQSAVSFTRIEGHVPLQRQGARGFEGIAVQSCPRRRAGVACDERTTDAVDNSC